MITEVFVDGERVALDPSRAIGKGGEADVFDMRDGRALKIFKPSDHPDYRGLPLEQKAAEQRIDLQQRKLRAFPKSLPAAAIVPESLATDRSGALVLGYAMRLVANAAPLRSYADPGFRRSGVPNAVVVRFFAALARTVRALHAQGVVIGDFNDLNVLARDGQPYIIDTDSFQIGAFPCAVFTETFVDPRLCDPTAEAPLLTKPYDPDADWYAFTAMLFQSLLFVGPYGGVYRPQDPAKRRTHRRRPLERITVFHPEVRYPKPAARYDVLPDELLHYFHGVFEHDERSAFPERLLQTLEFTTCAPCGEEHARTQCPRCAAPSVVAALPKTIAVEPLFRTTGTIVLAAMAGGELRVVAHDGRAYRSEDGTLLFDGPLDAALRFRICGAATLLGRGGEVIRLDLGAEMRWSVDGDGSSGPAFDASERHAYWVRGGRLYRDASTAFDPHATLVLGEVLANQTRIFVGPRFGIGFYRAGTLARAFVFDAERRQLNDEVQLPPLDGELLEVTATLDTSRAWLFLAIKRAGRIRNVCCVYSSTGALEASFEADAGDGTWLSTLRGKCAAGGVLFAPTDDGIVRLDVRDGTITVARHFRETAEHVDEGCSLLVGRHGLCVVRRHDIIALQLSR